LLFIDSQCSSVVILHREFSYGITVRYLQCSYCGDYDSPALSRGGAAGEVIVYCVSELSSRALSAVLHNPATLMSGRLAQPQQPPSIPHVAACPRSAGPDRSSLTVITRRRVKVSRPDQTRPDQTGPTLCWSRPWAHTPRTGTRPLQLFQKRFEDISV